MTAPVQGCLPDNIDGRLLDLDSDDSSEFCLGYHDARAVVLITYTGSGLG
jgi:hypothetical protein